MSEMSSTSDREEVSGDQGADGVQQAPQEAMGEDMQEDLDEIMRPEALDQQRQAARRQGQDFLETLNEETQEAWRQGQPAAAQTLHQDRQATVRPQPYNILTAFREEVLESLLLQEQRVREILNKERDDLLGVVEESQETLREGIFAAFYRQGRDLRSMMDWAKSKAEKTDKDIAKLQRRLRWLVGAIEWATPTHSDGDVERESTTPSEESVGTDDGAASVKGRRRSHARVHKAKKRVSSTTVRRVRDTASSSRAPGISVPLVLGHELLQAVKDNRLNDAVFLLDIRASVNFATKSGRTVLMWASEWGRPDAVSLLLARGARVYSRSPDGRTALHFALFRKGCAECVALLVAAGADVNAQSVDGKSTLHLAAAAGNAEAVRLLLEAGANTSSMDSQGRTPAEVAADGDIRKLLKP